MIVRKIDGQPIDEALTRAREEIGASSSEQSLEMRAFSKILAGEPETTLKLELIDRAGKSLTVDLRRQTLASKPSVSARFLDSGVAYIKFSGFVETLENEIKQTLERFKDAPTHAGTSEMDAAKLKEAIDFAVANESKAPRNLELAHYQTFGREPFGEAVGAFKERGARPESFQKRLHRRRMGRARPR
jgi:hypothetical protein